MEKISESNTPMKKRIISKMLAPSCMFLASASPPVDPWLSSSSPQALCSEMSDLSKGCNAKADSSHNEEGCFDPSTCGLDDLLQYIFDPNTIQLISSKSEMDRISGQPEGSASTSCSGKAVHSASQGRGCPELNVSDACTSQTGNLLSGMTYGLVSATGEGGNAAVSGESDSGCSSSTRAAGKRKPRASSTRNRGEQASRSRSANMAATERCTALDRQPGKPLGLVFPKRSEGDLDLLRRMYVGGDAMPQGTKRRGRHRVVTARVIDGCQVARVYYSNGQSYDNLFANKERLSHIFEMYRQVFKLERNTAITEKVFEDICNKASVFVSANLKMWLLKTMMDGYDARKLDDGPASPIRNYAKMISIGFNGVMSSSVPDKIELSVMAWIDLHFLFVFLSTNVEQNMRILSQEPYITYFFLSISTPTWDTEYLVLLRYRVLKLNSNHPELGVLPSLAGCPKTATFITLLLRFLADQRTDLAKETVMRAVCQVYCDRPDVKDNVTVRMDHFGAFYEAFTSNIFARSLAKILSAVESHSARYEVRFKQHTNTLDKILKKIGRKMQAFFKLIAPEPLSFLDLGGVDDYITIEAMNDINTEITNLTTDWCDTIEKSQIPDMINLKYTICNALEAVAETSRGIFFLSFARLEDLESLRANESTIPTPVFKCFTSMRFDPLRIKLFVDHYWRQLHNEIANTLRVSGARQIT